MFWRARRRDRKLESETECFQMSSFTSPRQLGHIFANAPVPTKPSLSPSGNAESTNFQSRFGSMAGGLDKIAAIEQHGQKAVTDDFGEEDKIFEVEDVTTFSFTQATRRESWHAACPFNQNLLEDYFTAFGKESSAVSPCWRKLRSQGCLNNGRGERERRKKCAPAGARPHRSHSHHGTRGGQIPALGHGECVHPWGVIRESAGRLSDEAAGNI